jgi:small subunit ribosomal protein S21
MPARLYTAAGPVASGGADRWSPAPWAGLREGWTGRRREGYISRSGAPVDVRLYLSGQESVMIEIQIGEGDRIEWALKQFRRKMLRSGLFKDMKKKRFYEKPSEARKRKAADARRRNARARRRR